MIIKEINNRMRQFKICSVCKKELPVRSFSKNKPNSYRNQCKKCYRVLQKKHEEEIKQMHLREGIKEDAPHTCCVCKITKTRKDFHMDRTKKAGVVSTCKECAIKRGRNHYENKRKSNLFTIFGITETEKQQLLEFQEGVCAICKSPTPKGKQTWVLDHCHSTNEIRGVLCNPCNVSLGAIQDSPQVLSDMIKYLNKFPAREFFGKPKFAEKTLKYTKRN